MDNQKIISNLNAAKIALFKLKIKLSCTRSKYAFETEETRLKEKIETAVSRLSERLDRIEGLTVSSEFSDQDIEKESNEIVNEIVNIPPSEREPSFKCLSSYKACKAELKIPISF